MARKSWVKCREQAAAVGVEQAAVTSGRDAVTRHCQSGAPLRDRSRQPTVPFTQSESAHVSGYLSRYRSILYA